MSRLVKWGLIAFIVFYIATNPAGAAGSVHHAYNGIHAFATSLATLVNSL